MTTYAFELSGEHETLPKSEVWALLDIYSSSWNIISFFDQCLIAEAKDLDVDALAARLAMTHRIIEVLEVCQATPEDLEAAASRIDLKGKSYSVRAHKIKEAVPGASEVERDVGRVLWRRGYKADLGRPQIRLRAIITSGKIVLGIEVAVVDRGSFEARRPHLKPFFHPGVLMPRMARSLVNIVQARAGERLIDPFAGTCGILIEACLIGIDCIGVEVQERLVCGALCNLSGLSCTLVSGDAKRLPFKASSFHAAVLDTPYGRSAKILASSKEDLIKKSLIELHRVIIPGRRIAIVADRQIVDLLESTGFIILEVHTDRVHRSLTRHIFVCENRMEYILDLEKNYKNCLSVKE